MGRKRIAVLFNFRKGWMGGIIYIINLVNALNHLEEEDKPEILLFYQQDLEEFIPQFRYPYLKTYPHAFPGIIKGYLLSMILRKNVFVERLAADYGLQGIYPLNDWPVSGDRLLARGTRVVAWIPDLQHKFYPQFFHPMRLRFRELRIRWVLGRARDLAVSSHDVESHFRKFYSVSPKLRIHTLRFVSTIEDAPFLSPAELQQKYAIDSSYFLISNQFTNHKNHMVALRAVARLKKEGKYVCLVCTGKLEFKGNERYIAEVRSFIAAEGLESNVRLLGIVPRHDQLSLMKHSQAVLQPSLFEGWSTVIEDAKTLQVPVIASDLPVNVEQLGERGRYFSPEDEDQLATLLRNFVPWSPGYDPYLERVRAFARSFVSMFDGERDGSTNARK